MRIRIIGIFGIVFAMLFAQAAPAQELPGDPQEGRALAATVCAGCHAIDKAVTDADGGGAPSFQSVADNPAMTALALRVFLRTPHADMPDLILSNAETDDLIAYILGLKRRK